MEFYEAVQEQGPLVELIPFPYLEYVNTPYPFTPSFLFSLLFKHRNHGALIHRDTERRFPCIESQLPPGSLPFSRHQSTSEPFHLSTTLFFSPHPLTLHPSTLIPSFLLRQTVLLLCMQMSPSDVEMTFQFYHSRISLSSPVNMACILTLYPECARSSLHYIFLLAF